MLIDTKNIIPKTNLRQQLNSLIEEVKRGKTLAISDRGELVAVLSPISSLEKQETQSQTNLLLETVQLAERIDQKNGDWETLSALKKLRKRREKNLQKNPK